MSATYTPRTTKMLRPAGRPHRVWERYVTKLTDDEVKASVSGRDLAFKRANGDWVETLDFLIACARSPAPDLKGATKAASGRWYVDAWDVAGLPHRVLITSALVERVPA